MLLNLPAPATIKATGDPFDGSSTVPMETASCVIPAETPRNAPYKPVRPASSSSQQAPVTWPVRQAVNAPEIRSTVRHVR